MTKVKKTFLKITGAINYSTEIDEVLAGKIISICGLKSGESRIEILNKLGLTAHEDDTVPGSIIEYIDKYNPKRNPDKILVIAVYLKEKKNQQFFKPNDIKPYFPKAGEPIPGNFNRDFKWLQFSRWIAEAEDQRGSFYVTKKGLNVVQGGFSRELVSESRGKANIKRHRKTFRN